MTSRPRAKRRVSRHSTCSETTPRSSLSLRSSSAFVVFVLDQLDGLPDLFARSMFGGTGLYSAGTFFGIIADDKLYFKVDDRTRGRYEAAGMGPFKPYAHRPTTFMYYEVPLGVLESAAELVEWARDAVTAAQTTSPSSTRHRTKARPRTRGSHGRR